MAQSRLINGLLRFGAGVFLLLSCISSKGWAAEVTVDQRSLARSISHYIMGLMHDWDGATQRAIEEYSKAAEFDVTSSVIHLRLGTDYARLNKLQEAIAEFKQAAQLNPSDVQPHYLLALIYSAQEDFDKAGQEYETVLTRLSATDPQNVEVHGYLGQLYYSQKKFDKAIEQFKKILVLEPKNADVLYALGALYSEIKDHSKAIESFKKSIEIDPDHDGSLNSLSYMYAEDGVNLDEALDLIQKALKLAPDNGAYLDSLGWVYYKKGMYAEALENLLKAKDLFKDPVIYEHLGDVYYKMQQNENAEGNWKQSLELQPNQDAILKKLENLKQGAKAAPAFLKSDSEETGTVPTSPKSDQRKVGAVQ